MRQFRELSRFLLCFFIGILAGTIVANWLAGWWQGVPEFMAHYLTYRSTLAAQAWEIRLLQLAPQRLAVPLIFWIIGKSSGAKKTFTLITVAAGIFLSVQIAWLTCMHGLRGLLVFFMLTLPQWLGYAPVWCVMAWGNSQSFQNREKLMLTGWYLAGLLGEVILNPFLIIFI